MHLHGAAGRKVLQPILRRRRIRRSRDRVRLWAPCLLEIEVPSVLQRWKRSTGARDNLSRAPTTKIRFGGSDATPILYCCVVARDNLGHGIEQSESGFSERSKPKRPRRHVRHTLGRQRNRSGLLGWKHLLRRRDSIKRRLRHNRRIYRRIVICQ